MECESSMVSVVILSEAKDLLVWAERRRVVPPATTMAPYGIP